MSLKAEAISGAKWNTLSTAATALVQPLQVFTLAALLTKSDFGLFAMASIIMHFSRNFSDMGLGAAVIHRQDATSEQLSSVYWLNVISGWTIALLIIAVAPLCGLFFRNPDLATLLRWFSISFFILPFGQQFQYLLQKDLCFKPLAVTEISSVSTGAVISVATALMGAGVFSFVYGNIASSFLRTIMLIIQGQHINRPGFHFAKKDLQGYLSFGLFQSGERLLNVLSSRIDSIIIGRFLGPEALGVYFFAQQLTSQVYLRINPILTRIAFPIFARLKNEPTKLKEWYLKMVKVLALAVFPSLAGLALVVADGLSLFYQDKWSSSIPLIQILVVATMLRTVCNPVGSLLLGIGRADLGFYMNLALTAVTVILLASIAPFGIIAVTWAILLATIIATASWQGLLWKLVAISPRETWAALGRQIMATGAMSIIVLWIRYSLTEIYAADIALRLSAMIIAGAAVYISITFITEKRLLSELRSAGDISGQAR